MNFLRQLGMFVILAWAFALALIALPFVWLFGFIRDNTAIVIASIIITAIIFCVFRHGPIGKKRAV